MFNFQNVNWIVAGGALCTILVYVAGLFGIVIPDDIKQAILVLIMALTGGGVAVAHNIYNVPANKQKAQDLLVQSGVGVDKAKNMVGALLAILIVPMLLAACQTMVPITNNPQQQIGGVIAATPLGGTVVTGLKDAEFNLDSAISIGVLPSTDPADACVHSSLQAIGQEGSATPTPNQQFNPKVSDLISGGSVVYILAAQARTLAANGGLALPQSCETLVGHFVLTGINAPANAIIGGAIGAVH